MVEVLISGGGPAGAIAALVLARRGVRVLLVDRARFPRDKLCGDTLNPGAMARLAELGLAGEVLPRSRPLTGMRVTGPGVDAVGDYPGGLRGRSISRRDLDELLLHAAGRAGAQVREGVRVIEPLADGRLVRGCVLDVQGRRVRVPAAVTIAADGRRSTLALALGLLRHPDRPRRWAVGAYFSGVAGLTSRGEMHIRAGHYIGVAPLPGGLANVCLVTSRRDGLQDPVSLLETTVASDPLLRGRFAAARRETPPTSMGPLAVDASAAGAPGLLLAGDAAGFVDPMTGDGMRLAIDGALLAADVAMGVLEHPVRVARAHLDLDERRRVMLHGKLRVNRLLRTLAGSSAGVRAGAVVARALPWTLKGLVAFAGDTPLASRAAATAPHEQTA